MTRKLIPDDVDAPPRGFDTAEFEARVARAQAAMHAASLDALLLTTEPDVRYFSGFLTQFWLSPTRPWFLLLPRDGKPVAIIPEIGVECMRGTWVEDIRSWPAPRPDDDGLSALAAALREMAGASGRVGLPMGHETHLRMPLADFDALRASVRGIEFSDATAIMRMLRVVKSDAEVDKIRYACAIAGAAFDALPSFAGVGVNEVEVFRAFKLAALRAGADNVDYLVGGAGPGGYGDIISPPSLRPLASGDVLILDTGCVFDGYFCDFDRNFAIATVDAAAARAHEVVFDATEAGLAAARPGVTCAQLFAAMHSVLLAGGALGSDVGRYGHGLGMQLTEHPSNAAFDHTVLREGMVLTFEPGMCFAPGCNMVHEENVVVREGGVELLTRRAPRELPVV